MQWKVSLAVDQHLYCAMFHRCLTSTVPKGHCILGGFQKLVQRITVLLIIWRVAYSTFITEHILLRCDGLELSSETC